MQENWIKVLGINDQPDGSTIVEMDVDHDFVTWFCKHHSLEKFSQEKFNDWFIEVLDDYLSKCQLVQ